MKLKDFNKVIRKLKEKFDLREVGSDHIDYDVCTNGIWITTVRSSRSPRDYQDQFIAKNLHISKTELREFIKCIFSNKNLVEKMKQKGYWPSKLKNVN